jgi:hypothetical protein
MKDFYVVWTVYDPDHEVGVPLCRAVFSGRKESIVRVRAESLVVQVLKHHKASGHYFKVDNPAEVEVTIKELDVWVRELKKRGNELFLVEVDE